MTTRVLIATNGSTESWPAVEYGGWLAAGLDAPVLLLGAVERGGPVSIDEHHPLEDVFARAVDVFQSKGVSYELEVHNGSAEVLVPRRSREGDFITVLGPLGRPKLRRWLAGRSIGHLVADIEGPIVYVPRSSIPLRKLLITLGGLGYEWAAEHLAIRLAAIAGASISLLHVAPPVDLDYPTARIERREWRHLDNTNTPIGRSIRHALDLAAQSGLEAKVVARQGLVVEEILAEVKSGDYDMVCMGSPHSATSLRQLYAPNVTAEVAQAITCPLLTARFRREDRLLEPGSEL